VTTTTLPLKSIFSTKTWPLKSRTKIGHYNSQRELGIEEEKFRNRLCVLIYYKMTRNQKKMKMFIKMAFLLLQQT
jgi:hypothetical protein